MTGTVLLAALAVSASTPWVLAVGSNKSPQADLPSLHYADDDAVAASELFGTPQRSILLATLDADTQARHPQAAARSREPSHARLLEAVHELAVHVAQERAAGQQPVVIVWMVGHGAAVPGGGAALALEDGPLGAEALAQQVVAPLAAAHRLHLVMDACHAAAMVRFRAAVTPVDLAEVETRRFPSDLAAQSNVGVLLASAADQKTFEWDRMRGGVFSGLVRSALRGAADADGNGCVGYDEVTSYLSASLQGIALPEARPQVSGRPPRLDAQAPLACGTWFADAAPLRGLGAALAAMGPFDVQDERGVWLAGGHVEAGHLGALWLPTGHVMWLQNGDTRRALVTDGPGTPLRLEASHTAALNPRGILERVVAKGLFRIPFGPAYLQGFRAASAANAAQHPEDVPHPAKASGPQPWMWGALPLTGLALSAWLLAVASGGVATWALWRLANTNLQRSAVENAWTSAAAAALAVGLVMAGSLAAATAVGIVVAAWVFR